MEFAGKGRPLLIEGMAQLLVLQKRLLGKHSQLFTRFGQRDRTVIAHKQRLAEIFFQPLNLPGERGGLTCIARALRPKWRLSARCKKVLDRVNPQTDLRF